MEENEDEELPPFRMNRQAVAMIAFTALMLVVPIGGVIYFLQGYVTPAPRPAASTPAVNTQPLTASLENVANSQLGGDRVKLDVEAELTLTLPADQIGPRMARITEQTQSAGGSALEMPADAGAKRLVIQVPASRRDLLRRAISGEKIDFASVPAGPESAILNVTLKTP